MHSNTMFALGEECLYFVPHPANKQQNDVEEVLCVCVCVYVHVCGCVWAALTHACLLLD